MSVKEPVITLFKSINTTNDPHHVTLSFVLNRIKEPTQKDLIEQIRVTKTKSDRNVLKKGLQCILFSGAFQKRSKKGLLKHSGYICLDFDSFENKKKMQEFYKFGKKDVFTRAMFVSPSDNGYKLVVKIPVDDHTGSFLALEKYYTGSGFGKYFDKKTKDVSRICYNSYDPKLYSNKDSDTFTGKANQIVDVENAKYSTIRLSSQMEIIDLLVKWWDSKYGFIQGEKNNNLFILANAFNQYGVQEVDCERYFLTHYYRPPCKDPSEISSIVSNAYKNVSEHNSKSFEDRDAVLEISRMSHKGDSTEKISKAMGVSVEAIEDVLEDSEHNIFWTKNSKGFVKTIMLKYKYFLESNGFFKYKSQESDEFVFVRVKNNLIENTSEVDIKNTVLNYLEQLEDKSIYEHFASKNAYHFTESVLNFLSNIKISLRLDSKKIGYVYYRNCAVKVTPNKVILVDYIDLDGAVWKSHVIDRDFKVTADHENDYKQFIYNVSKEGREDVVKSSESALGYLMHNHNDRVCQKAIILNDSKQTGTSEEGGVGKGLFIQGVEQIRRTIVEDGKDFNEKGTFKYQKVGLDTQVFSFDDVPKDFSFKKLFSVITDGMTVEKKNKTAVKLKYSDSPKIAITTNYVIKGKGNSHARRKFEIEFGEFYGEHLNPYDDFGRQLFIDWDVDHFNKFDNYMVSLIQGYMNTGLIESTSDTANDRKLIAVTDHLFVGWMESIIDDLDTITPYLTLHNTCVQESGLARLSFKEFSSWVEEYCIYNDYKVMTSRITGKLNIQIHNNKKENKPELKDNVPY